MEEFGRLDVLSETEGNDEMVCLVGIIKARLKKTSFGRQVMVTTHATVSPGCEHCPEGWASPFSSLGVTDESDGPRTTFFEL